MSFLLSLFISGLIFINPTFISENFTSANTAQVVVSTPQFVLQGDETERIDQTYPLNSNGRISVSNVNGSIVIDSWDKNEVKLEAVKIADSRERLAEVQIKIDAKPDYLRIETEYGRNRNWNCSGNCRLEVQYKLTVPRGANLNEIETVNGSVTISNVTNFTRASAVNGSVKAINLQGTAEIETVNGVSEISFEKLDKESKVNLSTVNGRINLAIPSDSDATIKAESVNGNINNDFNLPVRKGKWVGRDLFGKLGEGNVKINLESVNGALTIKRQQDGKNPKPVVNLLNMKEDADDDDDIDVNVKVDVANVAKMNKDIAKSVKESTKIAMAESMKIAQQAPLMAAEALKETGKAMEKAQRDLERSQRLSQRDMEIALRELDRLNFGDFGNSNIEEKSDIIQVKGSPKVTIDAKKCSVVVRGWDRSEVKYKVTKIVRPRFQPNVNVIVNSNDSEVNINANVEGVKVSGNNTNKNANGDRIDTKINGDGNVFSLPVDAVRIEVFVPKKSNLRILTDREIRVEGISGNIDLSGNDGAISVRDSNGKLKLTATDALVRVIGFNGEIDSKTIDGANFFEGNFAKFNAKTNEGKIILTLPEGTDIDIQSKSEIQTVGFDLLETESETIRRIGKGGKIYQITADDGEIFIRNAKTLNGKY